MFRKQNNEQYQMKKSFTCIFTCIYSQLCEINQYASTIIYYSHYMLECKQLKLSSRVKHNI